jgi:hypothetical protein
VGLKFIYLDPPYLGQAQKHYQMPEVDHAALIEDATKNYDGFALSSSSSALKEVLDLCPSYVRVAAWIKPFCSFKPNVNPAYAWEPVIWHSPKKHSRAEDTVRDWCSESITLQTGLVGAKPEAFCMWVFALLGPELDDTFEDRFPGTGAVSKAYRRWRAMKSCDLGSWGLL